MANERETVAEAETGAAKEYSGGCRCVQPKDERSDGRSLSSGAGYDNGEMVPFFCEAGLGHSNGERV
jgi:hypothetical protein